MPFTAIGAFNGSQRAEQALRALQDAGFTRGQISIMTRDAGSVAPGDGQTATARDAEIGVAGIGVLGGVAG